MHNAQMSSDSDNFYSHGVDSSKVMVKNVYDDKAVQNTIGTRGHILKDTSVDSTNLVYSNDRNYGKTGWNGKFTYETPIKSKNEHDKRCQSSSRNPDDKNKSPSPTRTTTQVRNPLSNEFEENINQLKNKNTMEDEDTEFFTYYVETSKIPNFQMTSNSSNFDTHGVDSSKTMVKNVYDDKAVQNTIGTREHILRDTTVHSTNLDYSNDRNYGKTGWNGKFTHETARKPKNEHERCQSPSREPGDKGKSPMKHERSPTEKTTQTQHSFSSKIEENINQFNDTNIAEDTTYYVDENYVDTTKIHNAQMTSNSDNFYGHGVDSSKTMVKNVYDDKAVQNTIGTRGHILRDTTVDSTNLVYSNDRNYGKTGWNGKFTYETPIKSKNKHVEQQSLSPSRKPGDKNKLPMESEKCSTRKTTQFQESLSSEIEENTNQIKDMNIAEDTTYYVDEDYVDTTKIHNAQMTSNSDNFYGHGVDSSKTMVKNVYDDKAVQNTIGTKGHILKDTSVDSTNLVYSNDRNYGKTGWNGKFTYEAPTKPIKPPAEEQLQASSKGPSTYW